MFAVCLLVAGALATARLTRLVTADRLTLAARRWVLARVPEGGQLEYLVSCAWCTGFWAALPVAAAEVYLLRLAAWGAGRALVAGALLALANSYVTGRLARTEVEA